ncbi:MAG: Zn-dependent oligopeptidase, partial [Myxococcales bacterium]|nr:Zn-dependent oligopeptidase [Myxococcales bacterium]
GLMFNVNPVEAVRDAAKQCEQDLSKFTTDVSLDRKLYDALVSVQTAGMEPIPARFVEHSLRDFRRAGVDKDEATRKRIAEIQARLVELSQDYDKNVNGDVRFIEVEDPKRLEGLPQDWLDNHKPVDGKIKVTTDYPDFFPFETYVKDDELRHTLYQEFSQRAYPANSDVLLEVLKLRKELATLLGYASWADYAIEDKMAKSADTVESFIKEVKQVTEPRTIADLQVLLARKKQDMPDAEHIMAHDRFYYIAVVHKEKFDFDPQSVRPYFAYEKVKQGVLDLYSELFGLEFVKLDMPTWAPGVDAYELKVDGQPAGRFFLDMHPRADKYKHAAAFPIQTGLESGRLGWASLVCNFPDPADGDGQALMEHDDVVTFFHEFGHLVHALIGRKGTFPSLAGFNVEWDFVEAPSQFLEEWAWRPEVLARFATDKDGKAIPAELVQKMRDADEFGKGVQLMRQIFYTAYSFFLHKADPTDLDLDEFTTAMYNKYSPFPRDEKDKVYANFGHLIGYSALYYTYQWSLAISKDLFTRFEKDGVLNKETALEYRHDILEPGGTVDADAMVEKFLGRPRNLDAYKAWISKAPQ